MNNYLKFIAGTTALLVANLLFSHIAFGLTMQEVLQGYDNGQVAGVSTTLPGYGMNGPCVLPPCAQICNMPMLTPNGCLPDATTSPIGPIVCPMPCNPNTNCAYSNISCSPIIISSSTPPIFPTSTQPCLPNPCTNSGQPCPQFYPVGGWCLRTSTSTPPGIISTPTPPITCAPSSCTSTNGSSCATPDWCRITVPLLPPPTCFVNSSATPCMWGQQPSTTPMCLGNRATSSPCAYGMPTPIILPNASSSPFTRLFHTGTLINDQGTIYLIIGGAKVPFTSLQAFSGLGYSLKNVTKGDTSSYQSAGNYRLNNSAMQHPVGSWELLGRTIYYYSDSGFIPVPSLAVFASNGGMLHNVVRMNNADQIALKANPVLSVMVVNDGRVSK